MRFKELLFYLILVTQANEVTKQTEEFQTSTAYQESTQITSLITFKIRLNLQFSPEYKNATSSAYKELESRVIEELTEAIVENYQTKYNITLSRENINIKILFVSEGSTIIGTRVLTLFDEVMVNDLREITGESDLIVDQNTIYYAQNITDSILREIGKENNTFINATVLDSEVVEEGEISPVI